MKNDSNLTLFFPKIEQKARTFKRDIEMAIYLITKVHIANV